MKNHFHHGDDHSPEANNDGIDRRGFLECMAWAGTGVLWMAKDPQAKKQLARKS